MSNLLDSEEYQVKIGSLTPTRIGGGSYGKVYESSNNFAVKIQKVVDNVYIREISILRYLNHINIIKPEGFMFDPIFREVHFAMKKAECTLSSVIKKCVSIDVIVSFAFQLLLAVEYLESNNIIHRDIKPCNILVYGDEIKVCDFGLSKYFIDGEKSYVSHTGDVQTIWYRSPEVSKRGKYDFKADIWSVGAIILELMGNKSFQEKRNGYMEFYTKDSDFNNNEKENVGETEFILSWFSYLVGGASEEIEWLSSIDRKFIRDKSSLNKLCRFNGHPLVDLGMKLLNWCPTKRLSASEALKHDCFDDLIRPSISKDIRINNITWFDSSVSKLSYINNFHRKILFEWLWEVCNEYNIIPQMNVIAFALFDLFISRRDISVTEVQLVGISCLSIVDKMMSPSYSFANTKWSRTTAKTCSCKQVFNMEQMILNEFNFDLVGIFDHVFKYRLSKCKWDVVCCMLSFDNPISIDVILKMDINDIIFNIGSSEKSLLVEKSLEVIKSGVM